MSDKKDKRVDENNKNTRSVVILIIVFLLIIIGLLVTIIMLLNKDNKLGNNKQEPNTVVVDEDNEIKITEDLKFDLSRKIEKILTRVNLTSYEAQSNYPDYMFHYPVLFRELTSSEKQLITLSSLAYFDIDLSKYKEVSYVKNAVDRADGYGYMRTDYGYLPYIDVNKEYREYFGEDLVNPVESVGRCPEYYYSSTTREFYHMSSACGGTSVSRIVSYKDKFVAKDDTIEVYINFGFIRPIENTDKFAVYANVVSLVNESDLTSRALVDTQIEEVSMTDMNNYKITEENKDKFTQYKFTFKKNGDNFYFDKVTKIR